MKVVRTKAQHKIDNETTGRREFEVMITFEIEGEYTEEYANEVQGVLEQMLAFAFSDVDGKLIIERKKGEIYTEGVRA